MHADLPPSAHLCVQQPAGDQSALAALDVALALRDDLRALGVPVTLAKNRLRAEAVNYVLGVEQGFDTEAARGLACVLVNTQRGDAPLPPQALRLLRRHAVVEVDAARIANYREGTGADLPVALWRPGMTEAASWPPLSQRPIELLVAEPPNPRQVAVLAGMAASGLRIARVDGTLWGPEREAMLRQARALLLLLPYDDARPDAMTLALALRSGTPVLAERPGHGRVPAWPTAPALLWFDAQPASWAEVLRGGVQGQAFNAAAEASLRAAQAQDRRADVATLWAVGLSEMARCTAAGPGLRWPPTRLNADMAAAGHLAGWCNVDSDPARAADERWHLGGDLPATWQGHMAAIDTLRAGLIDPTEAAGARALDQALALLATDGRLVLRCAVGPGPSTLPASLAGVQRALAPWTDDFWQRGGLNHRLVLAHLGWLGAEGLPCQASDARQARVVLVKTETSYRERTRARAAREDFALA